MSFEKFLDEYNQARKFDKDGLRVSTGFFNKNTDFVICKHNVAYFFKDPEIWKKILANEDLYNDIVTILKAGKLTDTARSLAMPKLVYTALCDKKLEKIDAKIFSWLISNACEDAEELKLLLENSSFFCDKSEFGQSSKPRSDFFKSIFSAYESRSAKNIDLGEVLISCDSLSNEFVEHLFKLDHIEEILFPRGESDERHWRIFNGLLSKLNQTALKAQLVLISPRMIFNESHYDYIKSLRKELREGGYYFEYWKVSKQDDRTKRYVVHKFVEREDYDSAYRVSQRHFEIVKVKLAQGLLVHKKSEFRTYFFNSSSADLKTLSQEDAKILLKCYDISLPPFHMWSLDYYYKHFIVCQLAGEDIEKIFSSIGVSAVSWLVSKENDVRQLNDSDAIKIWQGLRILYYAVSKKFYYPNPTAQELFRQIPAEERPFNENKLYPVLENFCALNKKWREAFTYGEKAGTKIEVLVDYIAEDVLQAFEDKNHMYSLSEYFSHDITDRSTFTLFFNAILKKVRERSYSSADRLIKLTTTVVAEIVEYAPCEANVIGPWCEFLRSSKLLASTSSNNLGNPLLAYYYAYQTMCDGGFKSARIYFEKFVKEPGNNNANLRHQARLQLGELYFQGRLSDKDNPDDEVMCAIKAFEFLQDDKEWLTKVIFTLNGAPWTETATIPTLDVSAQTLNRFFEYYKSKNPAMIQKFLNMNKFTRIQDFVSLNEMQFKKLCRDISPNITVLFFQKLFEMQIIDQIGFAIASFDAFSCDTDRKYLRKIMLILNESSDAAEEGIPPLRISLKNFYRFYDYYMPHSPKVVDKLLMRKGFIKKSDLVFLSSAERKDLLEKISHVSLDCYKKTSEIIVDLLENRQQGFFGNKDRSLDCLGVDRPSRGLARYTRGSGSV